MLLKEKLEMDIFSFSERIIVNYLVQNIEHLEDMTTSYIASNTHTHPTSIIRIAKKLNLSGWVELKKELIKERDYLKSTINDLDANTPFDSKDNFPEIFNHIAVVMKESIDDSHKLINQNDFKNICKLIVKSSKIVIFSAKSNLSAVEFFITNMMRIGYNIQVADNFDYPEFTAFNMSNNDVALFISYSGENPEILRSLKFVKKTGAKIISFTHIGENSLSKASLYNINLSTHEKLYSKIGNFNSTTSIFFIFNSLYACIFSLNYDQNLQHIMKLNQTVDRRISDNELLSEQN
ncbi:MurR/RpiR family transcriptional regulator [Aerococcus sanguinicola]|nr:MULTISPECIES: MurR/RpiR family transcriptional regulator [Aerococcus]MDK7050071.1 MurR/RpiR family transcriptional regulator [Aerococcus sanguinicola]OFT93388.1 hypothetical protein HMPREF3090_07035 [Aerococcus sp. HMSC23C02]